MKTEVKKIDNTKREINIEVSGDIVKNKFEDVFKKIAQEAKLPGFRQGHTPGDLLEKNFSKLAHEQVLKELVPALYDEAVKQEAVEAINLPEISEVKLERNYLSFKATVEVSPEIKLKDYKGIKLNYKKIEVSTDDVKRKLDALKESRKLDSLDDKFARSLGYPNLVELEKAVERQIFLQKENQQRLRLEEEILQNLTQGLDFKLPQSLVERQLQELLRQTKVELAIKGALPEKIEEQENEIIKNLEPEARNQVKVYLVLAQIAKKENIPLDDHMAHRVIEFLLKEADWKESS